MILCLRNAKSKKVVTILSIWTKIKHCAQDFAEYWTEVKFGLEMKIASMSRSMSNVEICQILVLNENRVDQNQTPAWYQPPTLETRWTFV